jgi:hypothetical protein
VYAFAATSAVFIGRANPCDAVTMPPSDTTVSRVSAILYPQPSHGLLFICDLGNLSGIRMLSREHTHLGLPSSVPFSRNILTIRWGERAEVDVCGVRVEFFPRQQNSPPAGDVEETQAPDDRATCHVCLDRPRSRCFLPCRHQVCCETCTDALRAWSWKCPICRRAIVAAVPIERQAPMASFARRKRKHAETASEL